MTASICLLAFGNHSKNHNESCFPQKQNDSIYKGKPIDLMGQIKMADPNDLLYKVDQRFVNHILFEDLQAAKLLDDIYPKKETEQITAYKETELSYYTAFGKQIIKSNGPLLSKSQLAAISSLSVSSTFFLKAYVQYEDQKYVKELFYAFSVIPNTSAQYKGGYEKLIQELKTNTKRAASQIKENEIPLARVKFRVSEEGKIVKSEINAYSGNLEVDDILVNSVKKLEEEWIPAQNKKGEKVTQDLFFFFGMEGC